MVKKNGKRTGETSDKVMTDEMKIQIKPETQSTTVNIHTCSKIMKFC